jgi:DNA repair protein RadC
MGVTKHKYRISDMQQSARPRERLAEFGARVLRDDELLAILIRVGVEGENAVQVGERLLQEFNGLQGIHQASFEEVCNQRGIGPAKAAQILAAIELGSRMEKRNPEEKPVIQSPEDAASIITYEMSGLEQEELWVLLLDSRNRVLKIERLYRGSLNSSPVRIGEIFKAAIRRGAASIIIAHNHPSGDPSPSPDDINLTRMVNKAGKLLDIELLDHIVIGGFNFVSLKERGLGFKS